MFTMIVQIFGILQLYSFIDILPLDNNVKNFNFLNIFCSIFLFNFKLISSITLFKFYQNCNHQKIILENCERF